MCFTSDYDWFASVQVEQLLTVAVPEDDEHARQVLRCGECGCFLEPGQQYREIYQQEHEECQECINDGVGHCTCQKPDFGETFRTRHCLDCDKFLQAIKAAELEEGCHEAESLPPHNQMINELIEFERESVDRNFAKAWEMFPELESSGYLARIHGMLPAKR
jgi:hypothetical protein